MILSAGFAWNDDDHDDHDDEYFRMSYLNIPEYLIYIFILEAMNCLS